MDVEAFWADRSAELEEYARLALRVGVNLEEGQDVTVLCYVEHAPLARAIARVAYSEGARRADVTYLDVHVRRARIAFAPDEAVGWAPRWAIQRVAEEGERRTAFVNIVGEPDPNLFKGLDPERVAQSVDARDPARVLGRVRQGPDAVDDRRLPDPRLGRAGLRRARRGAALGRDPRRPSGSTSPIRSPRGRSTSGCSRRGPRS